LRRPWYGIPPGGELQIALNIALYLRHGITTVVDLGSRADVMVAARAAQSAGELNGARILMAGGHFNWPGGAYQSPWMNRIVGNVADARLEADRAIAEEQIDIAKAVYSHGWPSAPPLPKMSPEVLRAIVERANAANRPVAVHADAAEDLWESVAVGVDSPEHMFQPRGERWRDDLDRVVSTCVGAGAYWQLTLVLFEMMGHARDREWLHAKAGLISDEQIHATETSPDSVWLSMPEEDRVDALERLEAGYEAARAAHEAGLKMTISTDAGISGIFHGVSTHREMQLIASAGVPAEAVLRMATSNPARKLRRGDSLGTVEVGKLADLVLLSEDPLASIENTQKIDTVIQGGTVWSVEELDSNIAAIESQLRDAVSGGATTGAGIG
jgi:imidazolonepropionase-like amidohydrolase